MGEDIESLRVRAEKYHRDGEFLCSEAVLKVLKDRYRPDLSDDVVALASGFGVGMGQSGCVCGALAGGVMVAGAVFGRSKPGDPSINRALTISKEIHKQFKSKFGTACCRGLTRKLEWGSKEHAQQCVNITGYTTEMVANIIEKNLDE